MEIIDSNLKIIFQNPNLKSIVTLFLVLYGSLARPKLPLFVKNLFENIIFRIFILTLIAYQSSRDTKFSLLLSICFILTLDNISIEKFSETQPQEDEMNETCDMVECPEDKMNIMDKVCKGEKCNENNCCQNLAKCSDVKCSPGQRLDTTKNCSDVTKASCDQTSCCVSNQKCTEITEKNFCLPGYELISDDNVVCNSQNCNRTNDLYRCCKKTNVSCKDMQNKHTCTPNQRIDSAKKCKDGICGQECCTDI